MMTHHSASISAFIDEIRGATAIEYGVMAAVVAGVMFIAGNQLSGRLEASLAKTDAIITATTPKTAKTQTVIKKEEAERDLPEFWELRD